MGSAGSVGSGLWGGSAAVGSELGLAAASEDDSEAELPAEPADPADSADPAIWN